MEKLYYKYHVRVIHGGLTHRKERKMEFEAYCVKCRTKRNVKNGAVKEAANGRKMAQGTCPVCGTKVTRFLSTKK